MGIVGIVGIVGIAAMTLEVLASEKVAESQIFFLSHARFGARRSSNHLRHGFAVIVLLGPSPPLGEARELAGFDC